MARKYEEIDVSVNTATLQSAIEDILRAYGDVVYEATADGIEAAAYVLMEELRAASPTMKDPPKGYKRLNFGKRWKVKRPGENRLYRYVGNTTVVTNKKGDEIPLANILEYSTVRGKPFIEATHNASIDKMARAAVAEIKKEV